jgi:hypothetical protein
MADHAKIRKGAAAMRVLLTAPMPPHPDALADTRWALGSAVMQHLSTEECHLYAKLDDHPDKVLRDLATRFQGELNTLFRDYVDHVKQWTPELVASAWHRYRGSAIALLDRLEQRIGLEERNLYPVAFRSGLEIDARSRPVRNFAGAAFQIKDVVKPGG